MEGFGLPPLEAMGYGAPVVASRASCIPEVLGDAALYFDPENVDDMAHVIEKVLLDGTLRSRLIDRGHAQVAKYSWQRMAEQTHQVYLDTLSR
jgi:glycosyltransferase involved in cell wall biosynthesis